MRALFAERWTGPFIHWWVVPLHMLFWISVLGFFVLFFGRHAESYEQSFLFVVLLLPVAMTTTYFFTQVLVPVYLLRGRYLHFVLYALYALVFSVYLELVVLVVSYVFFAEYEIHAMNPATLDVFGLVVALYVVIFLAMTTDLVFRWHRLRQAHSEMQRSQLEAELRFKEAEMAHLRSQIHPHFLFNTLNNLYGLTLEKSNLAPDMVLQIADMLDYILYRSNRPLVSLASEVSHLRTFVNLERLRNDDRVQLSFTVDQELPDACIAPLLLFPFVENSFKHSSDGAWTPAWLRIILSTSGNQLRFSVENSKTFRNESSHHARGHGIGLENVRRRLDLLYPGTHRLEIRDSPDRFSVHLHLPLHECDTHPSLENA